MKKVVLFLFGIALVCSAQNLDVRYIKTDTDRFPNLTAAARVYDASDEPVLNLNKSNFSATVDGKQGKILDATTYEKSGSGFNIMLCVDLSGSMKGTPLSTMKNAILKFIYELRTNDKLGIVGFADDAIKICDFSDDKNYLCQEVNGLQASGNNTELFYGAHKGLENLKNNKDKPGKILLVIGDGRDEGVSKSYSQDDVIKLAKEEGIPIFTIGYTQQNPAYLHTFEKMSMETGGKFYNSPDDASLDKQYKKLYRQILNIYLITFRVSEFKDDGLKHASAITAKNNGEAKTASGEFKTKGTGKITPKEENTGGDGSDIPWLYIIIGVVLVGSFAGVILYLRSKKRKKEEEERWRKEEEERARQQKAALEEEARKKEAAEKASREQPPKQSYQTQHSQPTAFQGGGDKTEHIRPQAQPDKTIFQRPGDTSLPKAVSTLELEVKLGVASGQTFKVSSNGATIGRKPENSIVIAEPTMSSKHARISFSSGQFTLEDLGSANGTFVNAKQILSTVLQNGDTFKFGQCEGTVKIY